MRRVLHFLLVIAIHDCVVVGNQRGGVAVDSNDSIDTFDGFMAAYGKSYSTDEEYAKRKAIFEQNLDTIRAHNNRRDGKRGHVLGVNLFSDLPPDELPRGYDKLKSSTTLSSSRSLTVEERLQLTVEPVHKLPPTVDWRTKGVTTPVKSQGRCGSCWAFASTAVLESHIAIQTGTLFSLSEQELVSCADNPRHCGGVGGCAGSTAELAFEHVLQNGVVQEWDFGYQSYHGEAVACSLKNTTSTVRGGPVHYLGAVASIRGYMTLPSNDYTTLMNIVAKLGPVAVSVACLPWHLYRGGVFYAPLNTTRATDVSPCRRP